MPVDLLTTTTRHVQELSNAFPLLALVIACVIFPISEAHARQVEIHPRVGNEIDQPERDYFNLFRQWPAGMVTVRGAAGDSIRFVHADSTHLHLTVQDSALTSLGTYLDRFEDTEYVRDSVNFAHLLGIARYRNRFRPGRTTTFMSLSEATVTRTILYTTPERMVVLEGDEAYHWRDADTRVQMIRPEPLGQIVQPRPIWSTTPRGLLAISASVLPFLLVHQDMSVNDGLDMLGVSPAVYLAFRGAIAPRLYRIDGDGAAFRSASSKLSSRGAFPDGLLAPEVTIPFNGSSALPPGSDRRASWEPGTRFGLSSQMIFSLSSREAFAATGFRLVNLEPRNLPWVKITVDRDRSRTIGYGAEALLAINTASDEPALGYSGQVLTLFAEWHRNRPELRRFTGRWSAALGAGVTFARLKSGTDVEWTNLITNLAPELDGNTRIGQSTLTGALQLRASAFYRLDESSLARFQLTGWVPPLSLPPEDRNEGSNTIYGFDRVSLPIGFSFGVVHELGRN